MPASNSFERFASAIALETYLVEDALKTYDSLFGQEFGGFVYALEDSVAAPTAAPADSSGTASSPAVFSEPVFSDTNTQVNGVDEADLIETDGEFIYHVNGQLLTIVDASNDKALDIASQFALLPSDNTSGVNSGLNSGATSDSDFAALSLAIAPYPTEGWSQINGMYLWGDRLTVIASGWSPAADASETAYSSWGQSGVNEVYVTVFDVADPTAVEVLETNTLEGSLLTSRAIEDEVVVVTTTNFQLPGPNIIEDPAGSTDTRPQDQTQEQAAIAPADALIYPYYPTSSGTYETQEQYLDRIEDQVLDLALPNVETVDGTGTQVSSGLLTPPTQIYTPLDKYPWQLTSVSTFDVDDDHVGVDASMGVPTGWVGNVFVSKDYLYLIKETYDGGQTQTEILQLDLETSELVAKGSVPGYIDNQFSVDEYDGFLRISTTTGFGNNSKNNIYVLEQNGTALKTVGRVEGLAPGERIFSTRFQGDYGFVVTFRQVDPLFALDLSDPENPTVIGELKIPGFSEYLQVIPDGQRTLLLGVGRDADPETGQAGALKVSLFDVTDLANPTEIDNYIFPGDFTSSEALWDHHAITYSAEHNLLAIPAQYYNDQDYRSETKLHVFDVDGREGLTSLGAVDHGDDWINRSLYIDDTLFAVSSQEISAHQIPTLETLDTIAWSCQGRRDDILIPVDAPVFVGGALDEVISGSVTQDVIRGNQGFDKIRGQAGDDKLSGDAGDDDIFGGKGNDQLRGGTGEDNLFGGRGNDRLMGGKNNDTLMGGAGRDSLIGGPGADELTGGSGSDRFILKKLTDSLLRDYDTITDLKFGKDKIKGSYTVAAENLAQLGTVDDLQPQTIRTVLTRSSFVAKGAATFILGDQTFLALNDNINGFQSQNDAIIKITGFTGRLETLKIV